MKRLYNTNFIIGFTLIMFIFIMCLISFFWTPYPPNQTSTSELASPSSSHLLGTDHLGRDVLSRVMKGSQMTFLIGFSTLILGGSLGILIGLFSGYVGGRLDDLLMRIIDMFMAIPGTVMILLVVAIFGRGTKQTIVAISIMNLPNFAKITRSEVLSLKSQDHILWARSLGCSNIRIIFLHILPDLVPILLVSAAMKFSSSIMAETGLSYLGLGIQQPDPSWGNMLTRAQASIISSPLTAVIPGLLITIFVIGFNLLSDGLREALNIKEVL